MFSYTLITKQIYLEIANDLDLIYFQQSKNHMATWAQIWQLNLATNPCQHKHLSRLDPESYRSVRVAK